MKTISSAEFRKKYSSLEEPVIVTVNGHGIGTWQPWRGDYVEAAERAGEAMRDLGKAVRNPPPFNSKPFRGPIPKTNAR